MWEHGCDGVVGFVSRRYYKYNRSFIHNSAPDGSKTPVLLRHPCTPWHRPMHKVVPSKSHRPLIQ